VKGELLSTPATITPITAASEEQKEDDDNENEFHRFLLNM
jgi:hypothetical protein